MDVSLFLCSFFLPTNVFSLRQCATVDCALVHEPSFPFEISGKDVYYSNLNKGNIIVTKVEIILL